MKKIFRRLKEWELRPYQVAPLSEEEHNCATCGTHYQGNFCPRCGQSAKIGRYSFKNAFMLFLDVWGLGNRGMFRSIRDLLLRPGYMIRDYLKGMQMAYFPPFQMYFLLFALSLLIDSGLNIKGINRLEKQEKELSEIVIRNAPNDKKDETKEAKTSPKTSKEDAKQIEINKAAERYNKIIARITKWIEEHYSGVMLIGLLFFSCPLWLLFRRCPAMPDMRLSECFVAMVYISNMLIIYGIIPSLFCFSTSSEFIYALFTLLMVIIPVKQLSGYGYWSTIWRLAVATIFLATIGLLLLIGAVLLFIFMYVS
ncbi:MAG: DUF3667 domain-containing protein [Bacteroidaceae bacterium]|nr:DUF3667 domain-containing protein [Bacteroidaceae bacterium]